MNRDHGNGSARNHEALSGEVVHPKSQRALARELGVTHTELWRWKLMAEIPEAEFERLLDEMQERGQPLTTRALADYARRRRGGLDTRRHRTLSALWRTDTEARMTTTYRLLALGNLQRWTPGKFGQYWPNLVELAAPILMTALVVLVRVTT